MFDLEFYETLACPVSGEFMTTVTNGSMFNPYGQNGGLVHSNQNPASPRENMENYDASNSTTVKLPVGDIGGHTIVKDLRVYAPQPTEADKYVYGTITEYTKVGTTNIYSSVNGYVKDSRTGEDASYIPNQRVWNLDLLNASTSEAQAARTSIFGVAVAAGTVAEFKVMKVLVLGKDALIRTGMEGKDSAKVYTKAKGSAGVLDPIDQRQSIGFKIDDIGFGSARLEAIVEYDCVPSTLNAI